jgi:mannose-6-phosphate isomerase-like protein (cupin superfamily)
VGQAFSLPAGRAIIKPMPNRRNMLKLAAGLNAAALFAEGDRLASSVTDGAGAKLTKEDFGDLRIYFDGPTGLLKAMTAGSLRLKPGMSPHPPHAHPEEEIMVVTEGAGEISVEGKITKVAPGSMMFCAAGRLHGIINTGKSPLLFYFYKWRV